MGYLPEALANYMAFLGWSIKSPASEILSLSVISKVTKDVAREIISKISIDHSIKKGILIKSLRVAFFGCLSGPDLIQSWELFSENKTDITLIERCLT